MNSQGHGTEHGRKPSPGQDGFVRSMSFWFEASRRFSALQASCLVPCPSILLACLFAAALTAQAEPPPDVKPLLDRAAAAAGGVAALARLRCFRLEEEGVMIEGRGKTPVGIVTWEAAPGRLKIRQTQLERDPSDPKGPPRRRVTVQVLDGDAGWAQEDGGAVEPLKQEHAAELAALLKAPRLQRLGELADDAQADFARLRPGQVDGKAVERVRIEPKGRPAVILSFAADTGLLVKLESRFRDGAEGPRVEQEIFYSDYRPVDAGPRSKLLYPHQQIVYVNGNRTLELTVKRLELPESLDPAEFARPKP